MLIMAQLSYFFHIYFKLLVWECLLVTITDHKLKTVETFCREWCARQCMITRPRILMRWHSKKMMSSSTVNRSTKAGCMAQCKVQAFVGCCPRIMSRRSDDDYYYYHDNALTAKLSCWWSVTSLILWHKSLNLYSAKFVGYYYLGYLWLF